MNAWKLTRIEHREKPRTDWPARWQAAGDSVNWQGALKDEFVALKTSPIWKALGSGVGGFDDATNSDSPPFAINSGMGWIGVEFPSQQIVNSKSRIENNKGQTMNEFKTKLILLVARLSEESCQNILARIFQRIGESTLLPNEVTAAAKFSNKTWDESEHPRAEDGKFTNGPDANHGSSHNYSPKGEDRANMLKDEVRRWDKYGKEMPKDRRLTELKKEIDKLEKKVKWYRKGSNDRLKVEVELQQKKRDLAELARDIKFEKRVKIEDVISKRIEKKNEKKSSLNQKRAERYYEIEDEMDHIEEMYGDRERGVGFNWPDTQDAYEDRKRYRKLQREQKRLDRLIDWDEVDKDR